MQFLLKCSTLCAEICNRIKEKGSLNLRAEKINPEPYFSSCCNCSSNTLINLISMQGNCYEFTSCQGAGKMGSNCHLHFPDLY